MTKVGFQVTTLNLNPLPRFLTFFTPSESERESEKDQRTFGRDQKKLNIKENFRFRSV